MAYCKVYFDLPLRYKSLKILDLNNKRKVFNIIIFMNAIDVFKILNNILLDHWPNHMPMMYSNTNFNVILFAIDKINGA